MAEAAAAAALQVKITATIVTALAAQAAAAVPIAHVVFKLPDFWVKDPKMWFSQAEAQFRRARITAETNMYDYVLMKLPEDCLSRRWFQRLRLIWSSRKGRTLS
jgi:hypothetical protein